MIKNKKSPNFIIALIGIIILAICLTKSYKNIQAQRVYKIETYYVGNSDSLWSIGKGYIKPNDDIREWVFEVEELNKIDGCIYVGQKIKVEDWR